MQLGIQLFMFEFIIRIIGKSVNTIIVLTYSTSCYLLILHLWLLENKMTDYWMKLSYVLGS